MSIARIPLAPALAFVATAALLATPSVAHAQNRDYSPAGAFVLSALTTAGPVAAGFLVDGEGKQLALVSAGLMFGPITGYLSGRAPDRGLRGLRFRGLVLGGTTVGILAVCAFGDCDIFGDGDVAVGTALALGLLGAGAVTISALVDIAEVHPHVKRANEARRQSGVTLSLAPVLLPTNGGTIGLSGSVQF